jgi:ABC-type transporter Mla maintaining outer membrane lipid asymmetry ATPase subunit MlaF
MCSPFVSIFTFLIIFNIPGNFIDIITSAVFVFFTILATAELCLELKKNHTLVVVEHDMSFIDTISEKVTVLAQGAILAEGTLAEVQANEDVIEKYLGR